MKRGLRSEARHALLLVCCITLYFYVTEPTFKLWQAVLGLALVPFGLWVWDLCWTFWREIFRRAWSGDWE